MIKRLKERPTLAMLGMLVIMSVILLGLAIAGELDLRTALAVVLLPLIIYGLIALITLLLHNR
jgi:hypothetical protein